MSADANEDSNDRSDDSSHLLLKKQNDFLQRSARELADLLSEKRQKLHGLQEEQAREGASALTLIARAFRQIVRHPKIFGSELIALTSRPDRSAAQKPSRFAGLTSSGKTTQFDEAIAQWLKSESKPEASAETAVLLIGHEASWTGAPRALFELGRTLREHYQVRLYFVFLAGGGMLDTYRAVAPCLVLSDSPLSMKRSIARLVRQFIALPGPKGAVVNTVLARRFLRPLAEEKVPSLCWIHDSVRSVREHREGKSVMAEIQKYASQMIYSSPANLEEARSSFGFAKTAARTIRYGMRVPDPTLRQAARLQLQARFGFEAGSPLILGCGTIQRRKGTDLFVQAALQALHHGATKGPWPQFFWLGAEQDPALSEVVRCLRATDPMGFNIHFVGEDSDAAKYFAACDLFVLTSRDDPYPFVTLEAMSWARPVLAFAGATGQEELFDGMADQLVRPITAKAMGDKIADFLRRPDDYAKAGCRGADNARSLLDWDVTAREFAALLGVSKSTP
jgi:glycosyltransferase involved in cell wall biosynthesis